MSAEIGRCPVCRAKFRQTVECSRCGADLRALMALSAQAYRLRREARAQLTGGKPECALRTAEMAQELCTAACGASLLRLARVLAQLERETL